MTADKQNRIWPLLVRDYLVFIALVMVLHAVLQFFEGAEQFAFSTHILASGVFLGSSLVRYLGSNGWLKGCLLPVLIFIVLTGALIFLFGETLFFLPWIWVPPVAFLIAGLALVVHCYFIRKSFKLDWDNKPGRHEK